MHKKAKALRPNLVDLSPPWIILSDKGKPVAILPAGRSGEVADVSKWKPGVAVALVKSANDFYAALIEAKFSQVEASIAAIGKLTAKLLRSRGDKELADE